MTGRPRWTIPDYSVLLAVIPWGPLTKHWNWSSSGEMQPQIYKQIHQIYAAIKFAMETAADPLVRLVEPSLTWAAWRISIADVKQPTHFRSVFMSDNVGLLPESIAFFLPTWSTSEEKITAHLETFEEERYWQNAFSKLCLDCLTL